MLRLDKRLSMLAGMIVPGRSILDVGTDHALLPAFMLLCGKSPFATASDIGEMPLKNAEKTIKRYGLEGKIRLRLSDGFRNIPPDEAEEIVIAGMGGTLISSMIDSAPWLKNKEKHLIIQPMTRAEEVRECLCRNGFMIESEEAVKDCGRLYIALSAYYQGSLPEYSDSYFYIGALTKTKSAAAEEYIEKQIKRLETRAAALEKSGREPEEARKLIGIINDIKSGKLIAGAAD